MPLPLPRVIPDAQPGGGAFNAFNHIQQAMNAMKSGQLENKYAPLNEAIKTQNAISYGSRMGGINNFLKSISELPVAERQAYLADPTNRKNYMNMLEQYRTSMSSPSGSTNQLITPELLKQAGFNPNSLQQGNIPQNVPQGNPNPMADNMMQGDNIIDENSFNQMNHMPQPQSQQEIDRGLLNSQLLANNQGISPSLRQRADSAIAFEGYLKEAQPYLSKAFSDSFKYNQLYGRGKNWLDRFKKDQPEEYANYIFAKNHAMETIGNGIRFLEQMGQSHQAQEMANKMVADLDKLDVSPETARNVFNKSIKNLYGISNGVLNSAEPAYPGVRRRLSGINEIQGDYIPLEKSTTQINKSISPGAKVLARTMELPQFNTKDEFKLWFKSQTPMVQDAVREKLGSK